MMENTKSHAEPLEAQMLRALELFHYAHRFRHKLFAFYYDQDVDFAQTITDLRVLESTSIDVVILAKDSDLLRNEISSWNSRGSNYLLLPEQHPPSEHRVPTALQAIANKQIPVLTYNATPTNLIEQKPVLDKWAFATAQQLGADKLFFVTNVTGLQVHNIFYSHPSADDLAKFLQKQGGINIGLERLKLIVTERQNKNFEVVLLRGEAGAIFEEIFTHHGRGTLFSDKYPNIIRQAVPTDTKNIALLIRAYVADGLLLPISEEEIFQNIDCFYVYTVNDAIVAAARLVDYHEAAELAKFSTLPRYQRQGRARELALALIAAAKAKNKKYVFALSIVPKMWDFFLNLGFVETDRQTLPAAWQEQYDFSRPSKAFIFRL